MKKFFSNNHLGGFLQIMQNQFSHKISFFYQPLYKVAKILHDYQLEKDKA